MNRRAPTTINDRERQQEAAQSVSSRVLSMHRAMPNHAGLTLGPRTIKGNSENRNSPLRIRRLIISDHLPKLAITSYGLDPAL
jgi:hypothetical protein